MSTSNSNMISLQEISGNKKRFFLLASIMTLVLISWTGILDRFSYGYLDGSFGNASALYILTRSINGVVSMLQTTTVGIGVASISVGELLDPINDIVERFSDLIVIAIGSIVTQKILLTVISSLFFKVLLTISGLVLIASIYIKEAPFIQVLSRGFIFLVFLRLSLSLMVLLSYTVDKYYLDEQIRYNKVQVGGLHDDLKKVQKDTSEDNNITSESNGIIDGMSNTISGITSLFKSANVATIKAKLDKKVDNILDLLILIAIQTLLLPILFMYLLVKAFKLSWDIELTEFIKGGIHSG